MIFYIFLIGTAISTLATLLTIGIELLVGDTSFKKIVKQFPFIVWNTLNQYNPIVSNILIIFIGGSEFCTVVSLLLLYFPMKFLCWMFS